MRCRGREITIVAANCTWITSSAHLDDRGSVTISLASITPRRINPTFINQLVRGLGEYPIAVFEGQRDLIAVFANENQVATMQPDLSVLKQLPYFAIDVTAPQQQGSSGESTPQKGFVYRTFIPSENRESLGSGASLMNLVAYWASFFASSDLLIARQLHESGGRLLCGLDQSNGTLVTTSCQIVAGPIQVTYAENLEPELLWS